MVEQKHTVVYHKYEREHLPLAEHWKIAPIVFNNGRCIRSRARNIAMVVKRFVIENEANGKQLRCDVVLNTSAVNS